MKNYLIFIILLFIIFSTLFFNISSSKAVDLLEIAGKEAKFNTAEQAANKDVFPKVTGRFFNVFFSLIGVIFIALMFYSGFTWMMARGNEEAVNKAKDSLMNAGIGLAIVISAYAIVYFVLWLLVGKYTEDKNLEQSYYYELNIVKDKNYV